MLYLTTLVTKKQQESDFNFDLIISGHNHGGIWPEWMKQLFKLIGVAMELYYPKGMMNIGHNGEK